MATVPLVTPTYVFLHVSKSLLGVGPTWKRKKTKQKTKDSCYLVN